jgi:transposase
LDAIFWIAQTGAPWHDLPERFGKWNTGRALDPQWRGAGVFDQIMAAVAASGAGDVAVQMIDSTVIWAQQNGAGLEKGNLFECLGSIPWRVLSQDPRPV